MSKTRLFNIRITEEKHAAFKKYAEENNVTMANLLSSYIDSLLAGDAPVGVKINQEKTQRAEWVDPLASIRGQYVQGEDF
jgi:hypothetical protein